MPIPTHIFRIVVVALLGAAVGVLVSCGSSGTGLIPSSNGGPLQADFAAVAEAATSGNGSCSATESALGKTEEDFLALPTSVDRGLRKRLQEGITNLRKQALVTCAQTTTPTTTTTTATTPTTTTTETTPTSTTPTTPETTPTTPTPTDKGGGTEAPGEGEAEESPGKGKGKGKGRGEAEGEGDGYSSAGGASAGGGQ
ncbi:MAG: hypothetical protein ACRDJ3_00570 [Solirubrobacteraceae bacterium]